MRSFAFLPLALAFVPATLVTATPPPALIDALSAYSAAGIVPTIPPGIKHVGRFVKRSKDEEAPAPTPAAAAQKGMEKIVMLPGSGPGKKVTTSKPLKQLPNEQVFDSAPKRRGLLATIESKLGMATSSAELSHESGKVTGDRQHYWYIEDSEDQAKWRKKDASKSSSSTSSTPTVSSASASATKDKRDIIDALANVGNELDAAGIMSSPTSTAGFVTSTRPASASSTSTVAPTSSSASSPAASASTLASGNSTDVSWTNPSTWGQGISNEVTGEYNDLKTRLNNLSILSKVGLATLVIVSTIALGFLIYCCCKLNQRRRRRNAAERVHAKLQAQTVASGGRSFDERTTAIPMRGYGSASTSASAPQDKKGKRRLSWSARQ
ncbi:hypothetical protein Rt10032_c17g5855 [Rhodotorula toruloides]|uniref:Proteophosphoglycan ppg4 n=1 Tax=Rhodotorula toruloides TaxID=5286 RepID=A0A511KN78_RHOTO|nr:hypothetical protein Rt10032_c17g5855 [Rhodotorula toruloides]